MRSHPGPFCTGRRGRRPLRKIRERNVGRVASAPACEFLLHVQAGASQPALRHAVSNCGFAEKRCTFGMTPHGSSRTPTPTKHLSNQDVGRGPVPRRCPGATLGGPQVTALRQRINHCEFAEKQCALGMTPQGRRGRRPLRGVRCECADAGQSIQIGLRGRPQVAPTGLFSCG